MPGLLDSSDDEQSESEDYILDNLPGLIRLPNVWKLMVRLEMIGEGMFGEVWHVMTLQCVFGGSLWEAITCNGSTQNACKIINKDKILSHVDPSVHNRHINHTVWVKHAHSALSAHDCLSAMLEDCADAV